MSAPARPGPEAWRLRDEWAWPALVALGLFLFYAWCAPRTVALEDDGIFLMASYFNGIAHPPGYPVFTLLGHLFSQLPFGSVAWRVHLVSALFGGLTCAVLWGLARSLVPSRAIATATALAYGFSEAFWSQAIIAEVYTLNTFVTFLLAWLLLRLAARQAEGGPVRVGRTEALVLGLLYGLGLSNHWPLLVLFSPAYLLLAWPVLGPLLRRLPLLLLGLGIGLLPYAWLYLRAAMDPEISFFGPFDGLERFLLFVSRSTYAEADHELGVGWSDKLGFLRFQGRALLEQFTPYGAVLALLGLGASTRHRRVLLALLAGSLCVSLLLILLLDREHSLLNEFVYRVYPLPAYGVVALLAGLGAARLGAWLQRLPTPAGRASIRGLVLAALVLLPLAVHLGQNRRDHYDWAERFARAVLDELPAGATLLLRADIDALPVGYVRLVLGYREDVTVYGTNGLLFRNRPYDPWRVTANDARNAALAELIERAAGPVCFVGTRGQFGDRFGLVWNGLTSCYDREQKKVRTEVGASALERYLALQSARDADGWTMLAADSIDAQMVHVLIEEAFRAAPADRPRLYEAIDRARSGLRGKTSFIGYSLAAGVPLGTDEALALLDEASRQTDRAYLKNDLVDLHQLTAMVHMRAGQPEAAEAALWRAVELKPAWRNAALPGLLTRLFQDEREAAVARVARLDPDLAVVEEVYDFFIANRDDPGFALTMQREGLEITFGRDGSVGVR